MSMPSRKKCLAGHVPASLYDAVRAAVPGATAAEAMRQLVEEALQARGTHPLGSDEGHPFEVPGYG